MTIHEFLAKEGYHPPDKRKPNWYNSPLRAENKPSFMVEGERWVDWGDYKSLRGDIFDLVMLMYNCDFKTAKKLVGAKPEKRNLEPPKPREAKIKLTKVSSFDSPEGETLIQYLNTRNIMYSSDLPISVVHFKLRKANDWGNEQFGIGFKNDKGGWEVRNEIWKGCIPPKGITSFLRGSNKLLIFEGYFDYISALQYYGKFTWDVIVLNSTALVGDVPDHYKTKIAFFDNDDAGNKAAGLVGATRGSLLYGNVNDFNDFIKWKNKIK